MLNTSTWKYFNLGKLFEIDAGIYHFPDEYDVGNTPYVSASNVNNGIQQRINLNPDFKGNCIVSGKVGCTTFYQSEDFCATSDVNIFRAKNFKLNRKIGLFITTIINFSENYKWNYGRQCRIGDSKKINIKLPTKMINNDYVIDSTKQFSDEGYIPDFEFIENFIENIEKTSKENKDSIKNCLKSSNFSIEKKQSINTEKWKKFRLGKLFEEVYKAKAYVKAELRSLEYPSEGYIPFITRTDNDNGCDCYVPLEDIENYEKGNAIIIGDTTATIFYQKTDFATGDHIVVCRAKWINEYTALFLKSIIEKERYKYNYGRAFKKDLIKASYIKLPTKEDGEVDFEYMESYIKNLPYGDKI
ncbi:hypothetical protein [Fusobacterium varium]|uniref:hypothetical protein n=1 Tax=Fusobacterium varium TaxID=856 RepID=UPI0035644735